jgi:hypothetical protein
LSLLRNVAGFLTDGGIAQMTLPNRSDVVWCIGLVAAGISIAILWVKVLIPSVHSIPIWLFQRLGIVTMVCSYAAIGAGIGALFKRKLTGALIVITVVILISLLVALPVRIH